MRHSSLRRKRHHPYAAIVVDETQDFGPQALRLLRALIEPGANDLFFVGDGHQRIYPRHKAAMSRSGIDIRGRARKLYINYRTTDEIRRQAVALLEGVAVDDLDEGTDDNRRYTSLSHGPAPMVETCPSREALVARVQAILAAWGVVPAAAAPGCDVHHGRVEGLARSADGCPARRRLCGAVDRGGTRVSAEGKGLLFATMHRAKGLEFQNVIVTSTTTSPDAK